MGTYSFLFFFLSYPCILPLTTKEHTLVLFLNYVPNNMTFHAFKQGEGQEKRPIFSLAPYKKGIYSVDFNASISLLQAFSICIAVINNNKSCYISEGANNFEPALSGNDSIKIATTKYVPYPPLSPAGRV